MADTNEQPKHQRLAEFMHDEYNRLSTICKWDVNPRCIVPFDELPAENMRVMLGVASNILLWMADRQTSNLYELRCGFIYTTDEGKWMEKSVNVITKCKSDDDAKLAGLLWIADRVNSLKDVYDNARIGYVKVCTFEPAVFFNGSFNKLAIGGWPFYEWKCDWYPYEKEVEHIKELIAKAKIPNP